MLEYGSHVQFDRSPFGGGRFESKRREDTPAGFLTGVACRYGKVHPAPANARADGVAYDVFLPGVFAKTLTKSETIRLLVGHSEAKCLATTNGGGLELLSDGVALSFAVELTTSDLAHELVQEVKSGKRCEMSTGYRIEESRVQTIDGVKVRLISSAYLSEISAVTSGAVPHTFVEFTNSRPRLEQKSASAADMAAASAAVRANFAKLSEMLK
jgi:HK97 family phage prohead protease